MIIEKKKRIYLIENMIGDNNNDNKNINQAYHKLLIIYSQVGI